jgi:hypothetical protein
MLLRRDARMSFFQAPDVGFCEVSRHFEIEPDGSFTLDAMSPRAEAA